MLKKIYLLVLIASCFSSALYAQYDNVWIFGHLITAGIGDKIDFNGTSPTIAPIAYSSPGKSTASVSGANGQLLFYTEGDTIWNKNSVAMPNGKGLTGLGYAGYGYDATNNTAQGSLIVPMPNNPSKYYVFSLTDHSYASSLHAAGYLYYSIVDMTLNGGLGDVVPGKKGIFMDSSLTEALSGVAGNSCNIWVMVGGLSSIGQASVFKAFELTSNGLNLTPVVSTVVGPPKISTSGYEVLVKIKFSPNRNKMVRSRPAHPNGLELFDFNPATGIISNLASIDSGANNGYLGTGFSPDGSKLYATAYTTGVYQYDLSNTTPLAIFNSRILVDTKGNSELRSAPDKKLYYFPSNGNKVKTIDFPNLLGIACQPDTTLIALGAYIGFYSTFPNVVPVLVPDTSYSVRHTIVCAQSDSLIHFTSDSTYSFKWDDGTTDSVKKISQSGTYWVRSSNYCHYMVDTFIVNIRDLAPVININGSVLGTALPYKSYQWFKNGVLITGATNSTYTVTANGAYTVAVTDSLCANISGVYNVTNVGVSTINAIAQEIKIYPNPAQDVVYINAPVNVDITITGMEGKLIKTKSDAKYISVSELAAGVYLLHVMDKDGTQLKVEKFIKVR